MARMKTPSGAEQGEAFTEAVFRLRTEIGPALLPSDLVAIAEAESSVFASSRSGDAVGAVRLLAIDGLFTEALGRGVASGSLATAADFDAIERRIAARSATK